MGFFANLKEFYKENKVVINAVLFGLGVGALGGIAIGFHAAANENHNDGLRECVELGTTTQVTPVVPAVSTEINPDVTIDKFGIVRGAIDDEYTANWDDKYRADYLKVLYLAGKMNLEDGEKYIIERCDEFNPDNVQHLPIVSHLIDGTGVYPPDLAELERDVEGLRRVPERYEIAE